eukprot:1195047-Prorocentrum_minimum.AAC.6
MIFAYEVCRQVDLYGFSDWRKNPANAKQPKYHYFDDVEGFTNVHSFDLNMRVLVELAKVYNLTIKE